MDNHLDIYINNNIDKDSSEAKYNVNFSNANHAGWFSDNIEYQNQEAKHLIQILMAQPKIPMVVI